MFVFCRMEYAYPHLEADAIRQRRCQEFSFWVCSPANLPEQQCESHEFEWIWMPLDLESTLEEVASRRCASCHMDGIPRTFYTRVQNPERNGFLLAPLAANLGGLQKCSAPVFLSANDPDYQKILRTFDPIQALMKRLPRADMANFKLLCD